MTVMYEGAYAGCWTAACVNTNFLVNRPLFQNKLAEYTASIFSFLTWEVMMALVGFLSLLLSVSAGSIDFNNDKSGYIFRFVSSATPHHVNTVNPEVHVHFSPAPSLCAVESSFFGLLLTKFSLQSLPLKSLA